LAVSQNIWPLHPRGLNRESEASALARSWHNNVRLFSQYAEMAPRRKTASRTHSVASFEQFAKPREFRL